MIATMLITANIAIGPQEAQKPHACDYYSWDYACRKDCLRSMISDLASVYLEDMSKCEKFPTLEDFWNLLNVYMRFSYPFSETAEGIPQKEIYEIAQKEWELRSNEWKDIRSEKFSF